MCLDCKFKHIVSHLYKYMCILSNYRCAAGHNIYQRNTKYNTINLQETKTKTEYKVSVEVENVYCRNNDNKLAVVTKLTAQNLHGGL